MTTPLIPVHLQFAPECPDCDGGDVFIGVDEWGNPVTCECRTCFGTNAVLSDEDRLYFTSPKENVR